jgi:glycosyltransferase involved in cell wall biosynthesis
MSVVDLSVLLPVHAGIGAQALSLCLQSIEHQDVHPSEIVIVEDGPLGADLKRVLDSYEKRARMTRRIQLPRNQGAGVANQTGLLKATGTWIAKVDADDILCPERFARQWAVVSAGGIDVLGSAMAEFSEHPGNLTGVRACPLTHEAIARRMKWNSPINHPTAMYRRELALAVGGYSDLRNMQDYDMFARILVAGGRMQNLPDILVLFRAGQGLFRRRASTVAIKCEFELQANLRRYGLIGRSRHALNLLARITFRLLPPPLLRAAYRALFIRGDSFQRDALRSL